MKQKPETRTIVITQKYYQIKPERKSLTRYRKDARGYFRGRFARVPPAYTDQVRYVQIKKDYDYPGPGEFKKGQIIGRLRRFADLPPSLTIKVKKK